MLRGMLRCKIWIWRVALLRLGRVLVVAVSMVQVLLLMEVEKQVALEEMEVEAEEEVRKVEMEKEVRRVEMEEKARKTEVEEGVRRVELEVLRTEPTEILLLKAMEAAATKLLEAVMTKSSHDATYSALHIVLNIDRRRRYQHSLWAFLVRPRPVICL